MTFDNFGIDYFTNVIIRVWFSRLLGIEPNSRAFSRLRQHLAYNLITKWSCQSCQKKMTTKTTIFKILLQ